MPNLVKEVFMLIFAVTIASLLYVIFFGTGEILAPMNSATGTYQEGTVQKAGFEQGSNARWEGLIYYTARAIENPIGSFYYNFCYVPSVHNTDYLDVEMGCSVFGNGNMGGIASDIADGGFSTPTEIPGGKIGNDHITFPSGSYSVTFVP